MQLNGHLGGVVVIGLVACSGGSALRDQLRKSDIHIPFAERLRIEVAAPLIVLGRVLSVNEIGNPISARSDSRIKTQLNQIEIDIEDVVKGDLSSQTLEFYYFTYSPAASTVDLGVPRYLPAVGQRRLYFLKPADGSYRSVGDITDYTLRVSSGKHRRGFCGGRTPGCCIAEILLVPEPDVDVNWFVVDLARSEFAAEVLCSKHEADDLMRRLAESPNEGISAAARERIAAHSAAR